MNLGDIRHRVLARVDESDVPVSYSVSEANAAINEGLQLLCLLTLSLEKTAVLPTQLSVWSYNLLSFFPDFLLPLRVSSATGIKVRPRRLGEFDALDSNWQNSREAAKAYGMLGFDFFIVHGTGQASLNLTYSYAPAPLVNDLDIPPVSEDYHPALVDYAVYHLLERQGGQWLVAGLDRLKDFMDQAMGLAGTVRSRFLGLRYDKLPAELERFDLSKILKLRKDLLPAREKGATPWTGTT